MDVEELYGILSRYPGGMKVALMMEDTEDGIVTHFDLRTTVDLDGILIIAPESLIAAVEESIAQQVSNLKEKAEKLGYRLVKNP